MLTAMFASALLLPSALAQEELPGPPASELADPAEHADAAFGSDVSLTLGVGSLLGDWVVPRVHTALGLRFDAFTVGMGAVGPRLGLSIVGQKALGSLPHAIEEQEGEALEFPIDMLEVGALCVLRSDPALPWGGTAGIGFSRLDLAPAGGVAYPAPLLRFEGGLRRHLGPPGGRTFLDMGLRAGWTELRTPTGLLTELWTVELSLGLGVHVR